MEGLIREYRESLRKLRSAERVPMEFNSMASDTQWAIDLMVTGHIPGTKWTVARWNREDREIPVDPLEIARYVSNREPVKVAPEWMVDFLDKLMDSLTEKEKEAYRLVRGQGYSFAQAGKLLGCNKGSVQNFVQRAEKKIAFVVRKQTISERTIQTGRDKSCLPSGM